MEIFVMTEFALTTDDVRPEDVRHGQLIGLAIGLSVALAGRLIFLAGAYLLRYLA